MKKALQLLAVSALAGSLVLTGCGSKPAAEPNNAKKAGGTLIYGRGGDSVKLDPHNVTDGESFRVTENIYDTLVDFEKDSTKVIPGLATEWQTSADGKTWTFKLRQGVKFHDGTDFNAKAVVYNFERMWDKNHPQHKGDFEYFHDMFGGFKGEGSVIEGIKAVDDYTVEFKLSRPLAPFLANLAMSTFAIISPAALEKYGEKIAQNPVGTGPFKFKEWKPNDSITLEKNDQYWQKGLPKLDKIVFKVIPDNTARLTALKSGEIDVMDGLNPSDVKQVEADSKLQVLLRPSMNVGYLAMNNTKKPFDNPKVRQAISMAINKKGLIDSFYAGLAQPAVNPMPPSVWGYNKDIKDYEYNPEKAKQLLAEAGYPNGFETDFWAMPVARPYMPQPQKIAEAIQADLAKIGIKTKIVSFEWATYLKKTKNGEHPMALLGWTGDNGDPDNFLYVLLDKDTANPPAAQNISLYKSDKVHELLTKAQVTSDQAQRTKLYEEAQKIIHEDAPMVPLVHSRPALAAAKSVKGYVPHPKGSESLVDVSIEK
ncbi:ABC transporter substrate-binding protein [Effusibacillus pohliae]|uniref:ABC transporter substrate-binding protein n=1 Tax=Effusibacillus pohliae TaxID=232270 RepID=UPI0003646CD0|nr:ABC transporter substrate-binding protein [Effusibacillus pohliae]